MIVLFGPGTNANIFYNCQFNTDADCLYVETNNKKILYVPGFEYYRAKKEVKKVQVKKLTSLDNIAFDEEIITDTSMPYYIAKKFNKVIVKKELYPERKIKKSWEVQEIAKCQNIAKQAIKKAECFVKSCEINQGILYRNKKTVTCEQIKYLIRKELIKQGFDCAELIVSTGTQTSQPHNRGSGPVRVGPLIIDVFPRNETTLYHGDITRTIIVGEHKASKMLNAVKKVQAEIIEKCVPGAKVSELHKQCEQKLKQQGFKTTQSKGLIHSLGHGVGLEVHEAPHIGPYSKEVLEKGMVITIEPGLYYEVGVRWEDIVVVEEQPIIL